MARSIKRRMMERSAMALRSGEPLRVLLLGRTRRNLQGGISRSARLIVNALESVGDVCRLRDVSAPLSDIPSDTDLIWHYGDLDYIEQQIDAARDASLPILINSTYDDRADKRRWMAHQLDAWDPQGRGDVLFAVFSRSAARDVRLRKLWPRLVELPKTIDTSVQGVESYDEREGICIGDAEKLKRSRLIDGLDVQAAVDELRARCPNVPIYAYNQYGPRGSRPPQGVELVEAMAHGPFLLWLGGLRLYVSLVRVETFAMVPAEAQSVGTVVVHRHMPQSLTEHMGFTAAVFDTAQELGILAARLYYHEPSWHALSRASTYNALSRGMMSVGASLSIALRLAVARTKQPNADR